MRDRRTLISTIVVPLLLFPVMSVGFASVAAMLVGKAKEEAPKIMILGGTDSPAVGADLKKLEKIDIVPPAENWKDQVINKEVRAVVDIPQGFEPDVAQQKEATVKIYTYGGELKSKIAADKIEKQLNALPSRPRETVSPLEPAVPPRNSKKSKKATSIDHLTTLGGCPPAQDSRTLSIGPRRC